MTTPPPGYGPPPGWDPGTGAPPAGDPSAFAAPPGYATPPGQPGWGPPAGGPQQTETKAVVALVLAVSAYTFVPFVAAIAAIVVSGMAKREIDASGGRLGGRGMAVAAFWLSVVHLVFVALLFLALAVVFVVGGAFSFS